MYIMIGVPAISAFAYIMSACMSTSIISPQALCCKLQVMQPAPTGKRHLGCSSAIAYRTHVYSSSDIAL